MVKKQSSGVLLSFLLTMVSFAAAVPFIGPAMARLKAEGFGLLPMLLTFYASVAVTFVISIILHEGGHWLAGRATGYRLVSFRVGPLMFIPKEKGTEIKSLRIAGTAGQCLMSPPDMAEGRIPVTLYNLGGALANLLTAIVCAVLFSLTSSGLPQLFLASGILVSVSLALTNGIPLRAGGINNDGMNALELGKDPEAMRAFWIQLKANALLAEGARLSDLPEEWFEMPAEERMNNSLCASLAYLRESMFMDRHEYAGALALSDRLLTTPNAVSQLQKNMMECDRVTASLLLGNHDHATKMEDPAFSKFLISMKESPGVICTQYCYLLLHRREEEEARRIRQRFEERASSYPYPCDILYGREIMDAAESLFLSNRE
jgi:hypothetical protein